MRRIIFSFFISFLAVWTTAAQTSVSSPDGRLKVEVNVDGGIATYNVSHYGKQVLMPSRLGLKSNIGDFSKSLSVVSSKETAVEKHYDMTRTKASHSDYKANKLELTLANEKGHRIVVTFQVSDNDIAFRYTLLPQQKQKPYTAVVTDEVTSFRLPDGTTTFISPQSDAMIGWERTKPSYEEVYSADAPLDAKSQYGKGYVFPALFHLGDTGWMLLSETGVTGAYVGSHLTDFDSRWGYTIAFPMPGELNGHGTTGASIAVPGSTPWRTLTIGQTLKPIVETTIAQDVVEPLYEPTEKYRPGRYTWSWLIWQDNSINWDDQVKFIDLAAEMGYEYCLVDGCWDVNIGRDRMKQLSDYAGERGVSLLLWYNSNGTENDAPQTPRHLMSTAIARDREMAWLKQIGVKGIKVDFFGGDKQQVMQLYEDILFDANRYGLQVIFHGCTLPRGWERQFPNYVASEAVLASENVFFSETHAKREPFDLTLHPFCRNSVASMDWGGIILNRFMSRDNKHRHTRKTTDVFEMASGITMQSSIQCVAIQPNNLKELPLHEIDFLKSLPTTWDETRYVDGYPGSFVVLARRSGDKWMIGGLNAEDKAMRLTLQLPMLAGQTLTYYTDDNFGYPVVNQLKVDKRGLAKVVMQPNGGMVLVQR